MWGLHTFMLSCYKLVDKKDSEVEWICLIDGPSGAIYFLVEGAHYAQAI